MDRHTTVPPAVIKKIAARATEASAKLENRQVPANHVRSVGVKELLSQRHTDPR